MASTGIERYICTSLLDIGPTAEGDIIDAMAENLLDAGKWLKYAGQCVYETVGCFPHCRGELLTDPDPYTQDYWYQTFQDVSGSVRFLTTPRTFCIIAFEKPSGGKLVVDAGGVVLPIRPGDNIRLLQPNSPPSLVLNGPRADPQEAGGLDWNLDDEGVLTIYVPETQVETVEYAWAFEVAYT